MCQCHLIRGGCGYVDSPFAVTSSHSTRLQLHSESAVDFTIIGWIHQLKPAPTAAGCGYYVVDSCPNSLLANTLLYYTVSGKKWNHSVLPLILRNANRFSKIFSLTDSAVNFW